MKKLMMNIGKVLSYGLSFPLSFIMIGLLITKTNWFVRIFDMWWFEIEGVVGCGLMGLLIWTIIVGIINFGVERLWKKIESKVEE